MRCSKPATVALRQAAHAAYLLCELLLGDGAERLAARVHDGDAVVLAVGVALVEAVAALIVLLAVAAGDVALRAQIAQG